MPGTEPGQVENGWHRAPVILNEMITPPTSIPAPAIDCRPFKFALVELSTSFPSMNIRNEPLPQPELLGLLQFPGDGFFGAPETAVLGVYMNSYCRQVPALIVRVAPFPH